MLRYIVAQRPGKIVCLKQHDSLLKFFALTSLQRRKSSCKVPSRRRQFSATSRDLYLFIYFIYLFICSNMIEHKTLLLKQLREQDNKAVINSADSCPN